MRYDFDNLIEEAYSQVPQDVPNRYRRVLQKVGMAVYETDDPKVGYRFAQAYLSGGDMS